MNIEKFQELAPKTCNELGYNMNLAHMAMGMSGELLNEVVKALLLKDKKNLNEELADCLWYVVVLAEKKGIKLSQQKLMVSRIDLPMEILLLLSLDITGLLTAMYVVGELVDVTKRESCYGKAKYQGKLIIPEQLETLFYNVLVAIYGLAKKEGVDIEEGFDRVITKLHTVRYKDGYSDEAALNRDLEAEKRAINGKES